MNQATPTPSFEVKFTGDASAEIKDLDGSIKKHLKKVLEKKLAVDPGGYGIPLRSVLMGYWKHQFASHRVIYRIYSEEKPVVICSVGPRKQGDAEDVYNQFEKVVEAGRVAEQLRTVLSTIISKKRK